MKCPTCGSAMETSSSPLTEQYRGEAITIKGLVYDRCPSCGEVCMSLDAADAQAREMARIYAARHTLLGPEDIKSLRTGMGLTQKQFERLLGVSSPTVCRWERGSVQQSPVANNLMRILRDVPGAADYLMETLPIPAEGAPSAARFEIVENERDAERQG